MKVPRAAATRSMHDLGAQHHSRLVIAVSRFCGRRKTRVPGNQMEIDQ